MAIVNTHYGFCAKGGAVVKFTYTGEYNVRDDGVVELLTSGTITFLEPKVIDLFMVGGGGGGGKVPVDKRGGGGGGGGFTRTIRNVSVQNSQNIAVTVGAGGAGNVNGNSSAWGNFIVDGGNRGRYVEYNIYGGDGGSGGGGGVISNSDYGTGGSNGGNGEDGYPSSANHGKGQGYTTREFGENTGKLYSGGGGGGRYLASQTPIISMGGAGGGGNGGWYGANPELYQVPSAGGANTGGGGGGTAALKVNSQDTGPASGGSGIVCFRVAQELPELAGTWVLNERLYAPENDIQQSINFTAATGGGTSRNCDKVIINNTYLTVHSTDVSTNLTVYQFKTNSWDNKLPRWAFPVGATASDEFRAWLASNATKQS